MNICGHKNYKAQYYDFDRKKRIYNERNQKVSFDLAKEISSEAEWTVQTVRARHESLLKLAEETWSIA